VRIAAGVRFAIIPQWVLEHPELSAQAVRVYGVLARASNAEAETSLSRGTIGKRAGRISQATVKRAVGDLVAVGALQVEARITHGRRTSNLYRLVVIPPAGVGSPVTTMADEQSGSPVTPSDPPVTRGRVGGDPTRSRGLEAEAPAGLVAQRPRPHIVGKRDLLWEATIAACDIDPAEIPDSARRGYNAAVEGLRNLGASPDEVARRAGHAWFKVTPFALLRHWAELAKPTSGSRPRDRAAEIAALGGGDG
jgi:hypothetical protein